MTRRRSVRVETAKCPCYGCRGNSSSWAAGALGLIAVRVPAANGLNSLSRGIWDRWLASPVGPRFDTLLFEIRRCRPRPASPEVIESIRNFPRRHHLVSGDARLLRASGAPTPPQYDASWPGSSSDLRIAGGGKRTDVSG